METVPPDDTPCRFIDPDKWDDANDRPHYGAFKASNKKLSLWHQKRVEALGDDLSDLKTGALTGFGEALISAADCVDAAAVVNPPRFHPEVVFRPDEADDDRKDWREAHVNVETKRGDANFPRSYRKELAKRCEVRERPK